MRRLVAFANLFTSMGTLLCCAIPSALVMLGFGASLAGFLGKFPQLIWLSENKGVVFSTSFVMLGLSWWVSQEKTCPLGKREDCENVKKISRPLFFVALGMNVIGVIYAFILPRL